MPPRIQHIANSVLRICPNAIALAAPAPVGPSRPLLLAFQSLALHTSAPCHDVGEKYSTKRVAHDPYAIAKAKAIRERNIARQIELEKELVAGYADPVVGNPTEFNDLLDAAPVALPSIDVIEKAGMSRDRLFEFEDKSQPNHFLTKEEISEALEQSKALTFPPPPEGFAASLLNDDESLRELAQHAHSTEAIKRITSLALGSSQDRKRANKQLCIERFGRHNTDKTLKPDPVQVHTLAAQLPKQFEKTPRVGPDTGSSEVQAAILTTKIRALVEHLKTAKKDKMNKRNLRVLCHKRQKILKYLKRKDKGGVRYRNVMEQLGLDDHAIESELMM